MKDYVTPKLEFVRVAQDVVTASVQSSGFSAEDGDVISLGQSFWE